MKKNKIFVACDTTNINQIKKSLKIQIIQKLRLVINLGLNFLIPKR